MLEMNTQFIYKTESLKRPDKNETINEYEVSDYLSQSEDDAVNDYIKKLSNAIFPVHSNFTSYVGNCLAITSDLVLAPAHCVDGKIGIIGEFGQCEVVFDGSDFDTDFKILKVANQVLDPALLSLQPGIGQGMQMYFKANKVGKYVQHIKLFESVKTDGPSRSDRSSVQTSPGESGGGRMSISLLEGVGGHVYAIHQGENEALRLVDILCILSDVANDKTDFQSSKSAAILNQIKVTDLSQLDVFKSVMPLSLGDVEEDAQIKGEVTYEWPVMKDGKAVKKMNSKGKLEDEVFKISFCYSELRKGGAGPRAIIINIEGEKNSQKKYIIDGNPHEIGNYNKDKKNNENKFKFYHVIATAISEKYLEKQMFAQRVDDIKVLGTVISCELEK